MTASSSSSHQIPLDESNSLTTTRRRAMSTLQKPPIIDPTSPLSPNQDSTFRPQSLINAAVADIVSLQRLPDVPDELKTYLATYVQRARELSAKDPVMCYWCTLSSSGCLGKVLSRLKLLFQVSTSQRNRVLTKMRHVPPPDSGYISSWMLSIWCVPHLVCHVIEMYSDLLRPTR